MASHASRDNTKKQRGTWQAFDTFPENLHILGRCYVKLKCYVLSIHPGEGGSDLQTPYYLVGHPWLKANAGTTIKL